MTAMVVTGFVKDAFPAKHLSYDQFFELGRRLKAALPGRIVAYDTNWSLNKCWAHGFIEQYPAVIASDPHPPADRYETQLDALISNVVLLQRYFWLLQATRDFPDVDTFAWLEYSILKQHGVTEDQVITFANQIERYQFDAISYPGQFPKQPFVDNRAHWRFSGSTFVCPRKYVEPLFYAIRGVATLRADLTGHLSWDMNTAAFVELLDVLPFRWYPGAHDETQLTNFLRAS